MSYLLILLSFLTLSIYLCMQKFKHSLTGFLVLLTFHLAALYAKRRLNEPRQIQLTTGSAMNILPRALRIECSPS